MCCAVSPSESAPINHAVRSGAEPATHSERVREIAALPGRVEAGVVEMADLFVDRGEGLRRLRGFPPHEDRFRGHGFDLADLLRSDDDGLAETSARRPS